MALKPRYKRRIFWTTISLAAALAVGLVFIPPMITMNGLKPKIEQAILDQTGISASINGDVHFSLLGRATIVAHNVAIEGGEIGAAMFAVPLAYIFDLENAPLTGDIAIYNANLTATHITPPEIGHDVEIHNSNVQFKGKNYEIIQATLADGQLNGIVRTQNHKYEIEFVGDVFHIKNQDNKLDASGQLYANGTTRGHMSLETDDINRWFGFSQPRIDRTIRLTTNYEWDGNAGLKFSDIQADTFSGDIELMPNGEKNIRLKSDNMSYDFSFLMDPSRIFYKTTFDLDFTGDLKFGTHSFRHLEIKAIGSKDKLQITNIIADDIAITGGYIDADGAHDIMITMPYDGTLAMCLFSGTPTNWKCSEFTYGDLSGSLGVQDDEFEIFIQSDGPMPPREEIIAKLSKLGQRGRVNFQFSDIAGTFDFGTQSKPQYTFAQNKTLKWLGTDFKFLPDFMMNDAGDFAWDDGALKFLPYSGEWMFYLADNYFIISGKNAKDWFPGMDMRALNDMEYKISGTYRDNVISNLKLQIAGHEFTGAVSGNGITLKTPLLNIDAFISQEFLDNYAELEFLTGAPIMIPFNFGVNVSLAADSIIYNGNEFKNFIYSLKDNVQTFSITDTARGNLLATLTKDKSEYGIFIQLNRFVINGELLSSAMPLNVRDTMITAEINMTTHGHIAHDLEYNLAGDADMSFDGGYIVGIGIDDFYAAADSITTLNAEYALADALESGVSAIKKMRIVGRYANGDFQTTQPIEMRLRHVDATGEMQIADGHMQASFDMVLRGTSPAPAPIELTISPDGTRSYSLTEIMTNLDPGFMRDFIKTHNKF